jgi:hypothetical protein
MAQGKTQGRRRGLDAVKVVGWGPINLSPKTTFAGFTTWSIGVVIAGSIGALLVAFMLAWQWKRDIPVLLALGALGGAALGALIYHFGLVLPFLWLRTLLASTPSSSPNVISSGMESEAEEEPYNPRRNPLAPDQFQPKPGFFARAGALPLPLTIRPHISPLYWIKLEVFMTALAFLLFLPLGICQDGPQALSIQRLIWLALIAAGGCFTLLTLRTGRGPAGSQATHAPTS